mgnify:CR=1 FL=1
MDVGARLALSDPGDVIAGERVAEPSEEVDFSALPELVGRAILDLPLQV